MLFGSQGGFRYLAGSQYRMIGSQRFRWNGSQMRLLFGLREYCQAANIEYFGSQRIKNMPMVLESDTQRPQDSMDSIRTSQELMVEFPQEWQLINRSRRPTSRIGGNAKFGYGLDLI